MKVGTPTEDIPERGGRRDKGKYAEIYKTLDRVSGEEWVPVQFPTKKQAYNFRIAIETHRTRLMEATLRNRTVYVRNQPLGKKSKGK